MKKLITLAVAVLAGALLFTGCYSEIAPEYNKKSFEEKAAAEAEKIAMANRIWSLGSAKNMTTYGGPYELINENGKYEGNVGKVFHGKTSGSWDWGGFEFTSSQNLSTVSSVTLTMKVSWEKAPDAICYGLEDENGVQVRILYDQNVNLTNEYSNKTLSLSSLINQDVRNGANTTGFDITRVKKILWDTRSAKGEYWIQNITF